TRTALSLCLTLSACSPSGKLPVWTSALDYQPTELHEISFNTFSQPVIPITINGDTVLATFDTGNMTGLLVADTLARRLSVPVIDSVRSYNSAGELVAVSRVYRVDNLTALGCSFNKQSATEYNGALPCLIGPRFFMNGRLTFDYSSRLIGFSDRDIETLDNSARSAPLIVSPRHVGLILVHGSVHGRKVLMELDTGKSRTVIDPSLAAALELDKVENGVRIEELVLGPGKYSVKSAKVVGLAGLGAGLNEPVLVGVGSDILSQMIWTIDYPNQRLLVQR
ncbi:MAG TPA: aspartyl protease family protein, partial [candidate division Zixibacteria bacterium]|nr:aspartyl protease family protein [candidate division Zixibacteria bacterium]